MKLELEVAENDWFIFWLAVTVMLGVVTLGFCSRQPDTCREIPKPAISPAGQ